MKIIFFYFIVLKIFQRHMFYSIYRMQNENESEWNGENNKSQLLKYISVLNNIEKIIEVDRYGIQQEWSPLQKHEFTTNCCISVLPELGLVSQLLVINTRCGPCWPSMKRSYEVCGLNKSSRTLWEFKITTSPKAFSVELSTLLQPAHLYIPASFFTLIQFFAGTWKTESKKK